MGKKDDRSKEPSSFSAGGRPGREHPDGWTDKRIEVDKDPGATEVYGFEAGGEPGWRSVR